MSDPTKPTPPPAPPQTGGSRIARNIEAMRAQGATEQDIEGYLTQVEGIRPESSTDLSFRNLGRSFTQGATYGFADKFGAIDRDAQAAFQQAHPIADFLTKVAGGAVAPIAATVAAPELATLGGAALMGTGLGAISGANDAGDANGSSLAERATGAGIGGAAGGAGSVVGYGLGKVGAKALGAIADRMNPESAVRRAASGLLDPSVRARLAEVDAIAPGGASIATAAVPKDGAPISRFLPMLRAIGANENAASTVEGSLGSQRTALQTARQGLGAKMDALNTAVPVDPQVTSTLATVADVLGPKAPTLSANQTHIDVQEMRDALSRLRFMERQAVKQGVNANGPNLHDIASARASLQSLIYDRVPEFAALDKPYAIASRELKSVQDVTKTVQRSRANYAGNEAYNATSGSLGGSLPAGRHGVVMGVLDQILTNRAGAADAVARLIAKPGGPALVDQILSNVPKKAGSGASRFVAPAVAGSLPALRGLLTPAQP